MGLSYRIDEASGVMHLSFGPGATFVDVAELLGVVAADPATPAPLDLLVDLRNSPPLPESAQLRKLANDLSRFAPGLRWGACALVASSDSHYGMSRMFSVFAERAFEAIEVFRELAPAETWLARRRGRAPVSPR